MYKQLVLQETPHGKRYWSTTTDPRLLNDVVKAYPPYLLGEDGYSNEEDAIEATSLICDIDLDGWMSGSWRPDDLIRDR